mmetsp:Transcript_1850/g.2551  ORF Transcript_1850/g.2551 Transcript_1850/m.2551 type:complete len:195 (+) Transcript_1850:3-587(+)
MQLMTMLKQNFEDKNISVNEFMGTKSEMNCPHNVTLSGEDDRHSRNKVLGITLQHLLLWQTFLYQNKGKQRENLSSYLVVFEDDANCAFANCGELALIEIRSTIADLLYLGWWEYKDGKSLTLYGAHAYAISLKGIMAFLSKGYSICNGSIDILMWDAIKKGYLTWAKATLPLDQKSKRRDGQLTDGIYLQGWR